MEIDPARQAFSTSREAGTVLELHHCCEDFGFSASLLRPWLSQGKAEMKWNMTAEQEILQWKFVIVLRGLYAFRTRKMRGFPPKINEIQRVLILQNNFFFLKQVVREMGKQNKTKKKKSYLVNLSFPFVYLPYKHLPSLDKDQKTPLLVAAMKPEVTSGFGEEAFINHHPTTSTSGKTLRAPVLFSVKPLTLMTVKQN